MKDRSCWTRNIRPYGLIYATVKLRNKRPPPRLLRTRNFKLFDKNNFQRDIKRMPFHIAGIFEDPDYVLWVWEKLYTDICDYHAPYKDTNDCNDSSPWISSVIKRKMNQMFKLFKKAIQTKEAVDWAQYKKIRNEITSDIRTAKAKYFKDQLSEITTTKAYWNLLTKATKPKVRKSIGPLRLEVLR